MRRVVFFALALALAGPSASALPDSPYAISAKLVTTNAPPLILVGNVSFLGHARGGILASDVVATTWTQVTSVTVRDDSTGQPREEHFANVDVSITSGGFLWSVGDAFVTLASDSAIGYSGNLPAFSQTESGQASSTQNSTSLLLAAPSLSGTFHALSGGSSLLTPLAANVTLLDHATGTVLPGWNARPVNGELNSPNGANPTVTFRFDGAGGVVFAAHMALFSLAVPGEVLDGSATIAPSTTPRFTESLRELQHALELMGSATAGAGGTSPNSQGMVDAMGPFAPFLNGALVVVGEGQRGSASFTMSTPHGPVASSGFTLVHAEKLAAKWTGERDLALEGSATVTYVGQGFATAPVSAIAGYVPWIAVAFWVVAIALIVVWIVRRPTIEEPKPSLRWIALAVHGVALVVVFVWWDRSFSQAFGTSILDLLFKGGIDPRGFGAAAAVELLPWSIASLLFALPVRLSVSMAFRLLHKGKPWRGFSKAAGLLVMGALLPTYALFLLNVTLVKGVSQALATMGHG